MTEPKDDQDPVERRVGCELAHHGIVARHAFDDGEHVGIAEDTFIGE